MMMFALGAVVAFAAAYLIPQAWKWIRRDPLDAPLSDDWTPPA